MSLVFIHSLGCLLFLFLPISIFLGGFKVLPELSEKDIIHEDPEGGWKLVFFCKSSDPLEFAGDYLARVVLASSMENLLVRIYKFSIWSSPTRFNQLKVILSGLQPGSYHFTFYYYLSANNNLVRNVRFNSPLLIPAGNGWINFGGGEQKPFYVTVPNSSQGYLRMVTVPISTNRVFRALFELSLVHIWARISQWKVYMVTGKWYDVHFNRDNLLEITKIK